MSRTITNPVEDSDLDSSTMRTELQTLEDEIADTSSGHDHDGSDSKSLAAANMPSGIDAAKIGDGSVSNTEFQYLNGVTSAIQTQIDAITTGEDWKAVSDSWSYASASTITVPGGAATIYQKGMWVKLTQTTVKYFKIIAVADTVLTVTGGSDYTVANAAISQIYISATETPIGAPDWFNYTVTGPTNTTMTGKFRISGRMVFCRVAGTLTGAPDWSTMPTLPVTATSEMPSGGLDFSICGVGGYRDTGTVLVAGGIFPLVTSSATSVTLMGVNAVVGTTNPITWASTDNWWVWFSYEY